jgi:hypothetical protein
VAASYGNITGVDNSVTIVIAGRHIFITLRRVRPAARTHSRRRARSESRAVHWDRSPVCAAAARPGRRCCDRKYPREFRWPRQRRERSATNSSLLRATGVALGSRSLRPRRSSCQPSNRFPPRSGSWVRATRPISCRRNTARTRASSSLRLNGFTM